MIKKTMLVRHTDETFAKTVGGLFEDLAKKKGIDLELVIDDVLRINIPRGFDIYYVHLSDVEDTDLYYLRKEQPWSKIYGHTGAGTYKINPEITACLDKLYGGRTSMGLEEAKSILEKIKSEESEK